MMFLADEALEKIWHVRSSLANMLNYLELSELDAL